MVLRACAPWISVVPSLTEFLTCRRRARRAGHGIAVLLKVYANCIDGQAGAANGRISDASARTAPKAHDARSRARPWAGPASVLAAEPVACIAPAGLSIPAGPVIAVPDPDREGRSTPDGGSRRGGRSVVRSCRAGCWCRECG